MLYVKFGRIGFMASEEMSFENIDGRMPAYTISSHMGLEIGSGELKSHFIGPWPEANHARSKTLDVAWFLT